MTDLSEFINGKTFTVWPYTFSEPTIKQAMSFKDVTDSQQTESLETAVKILSILLTDKTQKEQLAIDVERMTVSGMNAFITAVMKWVGLSIPQVTPEVTQNQVSSTWFTSTQNTTESHSPVSTI